MEGPYVDNTWSVPVDGIDLRDWFAGQVIQGVGTLDDPDEMAQFAYRVADALLKARGGA